MLKLLHISRKSSIFALDFESNGHFGNGDYKFLSLVSEFLIATRQLKKFAISYLGLSMQDM